MKEGVQEVSTGSDAEETGQVCVGIHKSHGQQGRQAEARARPPVLKAGTWEVSAPRARGRSFGNFDLYGL